jgi:hypothetical protein
MTDSPSPTPVRDLVHAALNPDGSIACQGAYDQLVALLDAEAAR